MVCLWPFDALLSTLHSLGQGQSSCILYNDTPKHRKAPQNPTRLATFHKNLVPIPFLPLEPDFLPEGAEASVDVPIQQYANLQVAVDLLQTPIKQFIADKMPDWIIADFFTPWVVDIAKEYDVPLAYFSVFSAATCVFFGPPEYLTGATRNASQVLAIRTCSEIEGDYLEVYKKITGKPVIPTGVLPPDQPGRRAEGEVNSDASMFDWLDKQKPRSVVFVGPLNARLLVEKGLAAEVKRNEDGSFSREEIAKSLRLAMVEEEGEQLRSNARKSAAVIGDHKLQHDRYIGAFVNYLKNNVAK
ncbi:hypothetical protein ACLB2K_071981 [Fragaria x ananassa]